MVDENVRVENALYGLKTELIGKLRDDELPDWLHGPGYNSTAQDRWESAKNRNSRVASFRIFCGKEDDSAGKKTPPSRVRNRLLDFWSNEKGDYAARFVAERQGYRFSFNLHVELGSQSGVQDIYVVAHYKN